MTEGTTLEFNEEDVEAVEEAIEGEIPKVKRRGRPKKNEVEEIPLTLEKLSGRDVVNIMRFLHRQYLSWLREAEASKYTDLVTRIRSETMEESKKIYDYIINEYEQRLQQHEAVLKEILEKLSNIQPAQPQQQPTPPPITHSIKELLEDRRVRSLLYVVLDTWLKNNPDYQKYKPLIAHTLLGDIIQELSTKEENKG